MAIESTYESLPPRQIRFTAIGLLALVAAGWFAGEEGDRSNLCAASFGPFRQIGLLPSFGAGPREPSAEARGSIRPVQLKCENLVNPLGIDVRRPRVTWWLESSRRDERQTAYQILVATSEEKLDAGFADAWDSGKLESDRSVSIEYDGRPLTSGTTYFWNVRCWDRDELPGPPSRTAKFETAILDEREWDGAIWIGASEDVSAPLLRKEFTLNRAVRRARIYVSGLGYHELYVNGHRMGDHLLNPAVTNYHKRIAYVTHDVTEYLQPGENVLGAILGNGWYSADRRVTGIGRATYGDRPKLILKMRAELAGGEVAQVSSDQSWRTSPGPITANDLAQGEHYDARLEPPGWNAPGFDDSSWQPAQRVEPPRGRLVAQSIPPIKVIQRLEPTRMFKSSGGGTIYDFRQHMTGWAALRASGPGGTKITLRYAGRVNYDNNTLDRRNNLRIAPAEQEDSYTLKGEGNEVWEPRFTLHGFRYVELIGFPGAPDLDTLEARVVHSELEPTGHFECSNPLLNQIDHNARWTFKTSFQSIPQDAADRDERGGWLGDTGFVAEDYIFGFDTAAFWSKWIDDIRDCQAPDGSVPVMVPAPKHYSGDVWPGWQSTYALLVWYVYWYYDDSRILQEHYDGIKDLVGYFTAGAENHIISTGLGDHMEPRWDRSSSHFPTETPDALCSTAYYYYTVRILAQMAGLLDRNADAEHYSDLAQSIKASFNREFFDSAKGSYATGSQTSNALPLYLEMVPTGREKDVVDHLVRDIVDRHGGRLSTGIIGTNALEQALPKYGRADVMYQIATQTTFPSWGYQVVNGATTIWEDWEGSNWRSLNMKMLASVEKFFYQDLAGIGPAAPGFRRIRIRPQVVGDLTSASASLKTVRGLASVAWERTENRFQMRITVPVNTRAEVHVPKLAQAADTTITEGGKTVWKSGGFVAGSPGITRARDGRESIVFEVGSGSYAFTSRPQ